MAKHLLVPMVKHLLAPMPENPLGPVPPFPPQEITTCTTSDDPVCSPPGSTPTVVTYTQPGVETPTPPGDNVNLVTTQITSSIYVPSYTTTNSLGQTIITDPSILLVIQNIAVTEAPVTTVKVSDSTILHDFNSHEVKMIKKQTVMGLTQARSKNLTFDEYVDGDAGRADGDDDEETPNYNYDGLMQKQLNETSRQAG
ncbi:hypothetical protein RhiirA4_452559 [Rhizophagus irregularis]|uniref:Uncharacterized protein n=1 Tax=Rhizophagus irregularis TaxID=588596 RepID=A0A2I1FYC0_9GLOM|nr:hypothetical protein RhiirA4_452559 [Rhizophagus irregularis]